MAKTTALPITVAVHMSSGWLIDDRLMDDDDIPRDDGDDDGAMIQWLLGPYAIAACCCSLVSDNFDIV